MRNLFGRRTRSDGEPGAKLLPGDPFFDLIEDAYLVFTTAKPEDVDVCVGHCMPQSVADDFFVPDIRDLPLRYLDEWYSAAAATDGVRKHVWTYVLPRILEVLATGRAPGAIGFEVALQRYKTGSEQEWSPDQWRILDTFQRRYLAREIAMQVENPDCFLDDVMCMFHKGSWSIATLIDQVMAAPIEQLAARLWRDWCHDWGEYGKVWVTAFWDPVEEARMMAFYTGDKLRERLEALALSDSHKPELAFKASQCVSIIENAS